MVLYLFKLKHLLYYYISLNKDFFDKIRSNYTCFNWKQIKNKLNIIEIIVDYKIIMTY